MKYLLLFLLACGAAKEPEKVDWGDTVRRDGGDYLTLRWKQPKGVDVIGVELSVRCFANKPEGFFEKIDCGKSLSYVYPVHQKACVTYEFFLRSYNKFKDYSQYSAKRQYCTAKTDPNLKPPIVSPLDYDGYEYEGSGPYTLTWDAVTNATSYKVKVLYIDDQDHITEYDKGEITTNTIVILRPGRPGHYIAMAQACNSAGCSDWSSSLDAKHATVSGQPKSWRIYWRLQSPTWDM